MAFIVRHSLEMFPINSLLIITSTSVILIFHLVASKCVYISTSDDNLSSYVECRNVRSMQDLAADMKSNWHRLKIVNEVDSVFTNAGNVVVMNVNFKTIFHHCVNNMFVKPFQSMKIHFCNTYNI